MSGLKIAIIGASGAIGCALAKQLAQTKENTIYACSRSHLDFNSKNVGWLHIDYNYEDTLSEAAITANKNGPLDLVIAATGVLHDNTMKPEKSLRDLNTENFQKQFLINSIGPALVAKYFVPKFDPHKRCVFAALSARVGSISDNHLGGWYSYRASKAALNMLIKTTSIEAARRYRHAIIVGLHPGTVNSPLSAPFQTRVPNDKLFSADYSATQLLAVLDGLKPSDSGNIYAWDGSIVPA